MQNLTIGRQLRNRIDELGIKQKDLAQRLRISPTTLNGYFTDYREPDLKTLERLANELDTTIDYLVSGSKHVAYSSQEPIPIEDKDDLDDIRLLVSLYRGMSEHDRTLLKEHAEFLIQRREKE